MLKQTDNVVVFSKNNIRKRQFKQDYDERIVKYFLRNQKPRYRLQKTNNNFKNLINNILINIKNK